MRGLVIFFIFLNNFVISQTAENFIRTYGGGGYDWGVCGYELPGKDYIIAGTSSSSLDGTADGFLLKIDSIGKFKWIKNYGGIGIDWFKSMVVTSDNYLIMAGYTNESVNNDYDVKVTKTDTAGILIWEKKFGGTDWDFAESIIELSDGDFIITGKTYSHGAGGSDIYILKINKNGELLWEKTFGFAGSDEAFSSIELPGENILIAGNTTVEDDSTKVYLINIDKNGDLNWDKKIENNFYATSFDVKLAPDSGFVICGETKITEFSDYNVLIIKFDKIGNKIWLIEGNSPEDDGMKSLVFGGNDDLVICGYTESFGAGKRDGYVFSFPNTSSEFYTTFGWIEYDECNFVTTTTDGGYLMIGMTQSYGPGVQSVFINKTDSIKVFSTNVIVNIEDQPKSKNEFFNFFPNPFNDIATIQFPAEISNIKIVNILGMDVSSNFYLINTSNQAQLKNTSASSGLYFYKILFESNETINGKFQIKE